MFKWRILKAEIPVILMIMLMLPMMLTMLPIVLSPVNGPIEENQMLWLDRGASFMFDVIWIFIICKVFIYFREKIDAYVKNSPVVIESRVNFYKIVTLLWLFSPAIILIGFLVLAGFNILAIIIALKGIFIFVLAFIYLAAVLFGLVWIEKLCNRKIEELKVKEAN